MGSKKYNFCTLFDSGYLSRGLALYYSLVECCENFHLYIFAFDDNCFEILSSLQLEEATVISLHQFEGEELQKVKPTRNRAEYCWTCTPSSIWYAIHNFKLNSCTYLDADLYFYNSPKIIFDEIGNNSIAITKHSFVNEFDYVLGGQFCVQFNYFKNDQFGIEALKWWKDSCLEWCFSRYEDGKFGDQKYIDELPIRFRKVHVIQNRGAGIAQWNIDDYMLNDQGKLCFTEKSTFKKFPIIFYHFHYTRYNFTEGILTLKPFQVPISDLIINKIYIPYITQLATINEHITNKDKQFIIEKIRIKKLKPLLYFFLKIKYKIKHIAFVRSIHNLFSKLGKLKPYKEL
jgi:hypothetical protein